MSWWTNDRQAYALAYLISYGGLTPYGAAGLVSRWTNVEAPNGPASRGGYMGHAWGIAQWLGPRLPPINGNADFDAQLAYVVQELNGLEARAARLLRNASDIGDGARAATAYERAGGWNAGSNTDNYTNRTAAGIPAVLANLSGSAQQSAQPEDEQAYTANTTPAPAVPSIATPLLLLGVSALVLYLIVD